MKREETKAVVSGVTNEVEMTAIAATPGSAAVPNESQRDNVLDDP